MRIGILGWGSLIKDPRGLRIVDDKWNSGGPSLPIELSRLSDKRGHLTYVIDERDQRRMPTRYAISRYRDLEDAIADLACREGCGARSIGYVYVRDRSRHRSRTQLWRDIQQWLQGSQIDAAIWTDLPPKFPGVFTLDAAVDSWQRLPPDKVEDAKEYAREAPEEIAQISAADFKRRIY